MTDRINIYLDDIRGGPPDLDTGLWEENEYWLVRDSFASQEEYDEYTTQWTIVRSVSKCIEMLEEHAGNVGVLSLDHDMGSYANWLKDKNRFDNGYDVLLWLEQRLFHDHTFPLPDRINIHSANSGAIKKMWLAVEKLEKMRRTAQAQMERDASTD